MRISLVGARRARRESTRHRECDSDGEEADTRLVPMLREYRLADLGGTPLPGSPADFGKLVADDIEKWAKVIKFANIKPE